MEQKEQAAHPLVRQLQGRLSQLRIVAEAGSPYVLNPCNGKLLFLPLPKVHQLQRICHQGPTEPGDEPLLRDLFHQDLFAERTKDRWLPRNLLLEPVDACNLQCNGCYRKKRFTGAKIEAQWWNDILDFIRLYPEMSVSVSGGEPSLHPRFNQLLADLSPLPNPLQLVTNGFGLDAQSWSILRSNPWTLTVSIDGFHDCQNTQTRQPGALKKALTLLETARRYPVRCKINTVVHPENGYSLERLTENARNLGVKEIEFLPQAPAGNATPGLTAAGYKALLEQLVPLQHAFPTLRISNVYAVWRQYGMRARSACGAGRQVLNLLPNRRLRPCPLMDAEVRVCKEMSLKDYFRYPADPVQAMRETSMADLPDCGDCDFRYLCGGGCKARRHFSGRDATCPSGLYQAVLSAHPSLTRIYSIQGGNA